MVTLTFMHDLLLSSDRQTDKQKVMHMRQLCNCTGGLKNANYILCVGSIDSKCDHQFNLQGAGAILVLQQTFTFPSESNLQNF